MANQQQIAVVATFRARRRAAEEVGEILGRLVAPTRGEEGCLQYDLHRAAEDRWRFMFYEKWRSRDDLDAHLAMPYVSAMLEATADLLEEPPEIVIWEEL